jgi:FKBP-type peptidyl-prolyl cis-trans isomerase
VETSSTSREHWPWYALVSLLLAGGVVYALRGSTRVDDSRVTAPNDPQKSKAPKSTAIPEAPMTTVAPPSGSIAAPPDVAAPPADAIVTSTGLASKVLLPGSGGEHPSKDAKVQVHYTGWTTDGKMFDSSITRGTPATFPLSGVIKGWTEGVQLMVAGEQRRFWIPADLAYGNKPGRPMGMLVFDVELRTITEPPKPIPAPADVGAPPLGAIVEKSGLATMVLAKGIGTAHPGPTSTVKVHYTGWTTDGKMFDSSVVRGDPVSFPLDRVIPGWTEGVQLMVEGEKRRLWIPEALAYKGTPGAPAGMLVFDVELLTIEKP